MKSIHFLLILTISLLLACTGNEDQRDFEREAYRSPSGITQTDIHGNIISEDPDDWRIAPYFQGLVQNPLPYPNPISLGTNLRFSMHVYDTNLISEISIYVQFNNGELGFVDDTRNFTLTPGQIDFLINPYTFSQFNTTETAKGLHRIFFFNQDQRLITYGDILVE